MKKINRENINKSIGIIMLVIFLLAGSLCSFAQDRYVKIGIELAELSNSIPALNEKITISVNGVSIQQFLIGIANNTRLNLNVDPTLDTKVSNNFSDVKVIDMLIFLCKEYDLDITIIGSIISIIRFNSPEATTIDNAKVLNIQYNKKNDNLSIDLNNDSLTDCSIQYHRLQHAYQS